MIHHVTSFSVRESDPDNGDDEPSKYRVGLQNGQFFEGWFACRAIKIRNKVQGVWDSPMEIFIEKKDLKDLEKMKLKRK